MIFRQARYRFISLARKQDTRTDTPLTARYIHTGPTKRNKNKVLCPFRRIFSRMALAKLYAGISLRSDCDSFTRTLNLIFVKKILRMYGFGLIMDKNFDDFSKNHLCGDILVTWICRKCRHCLLPLSQPFHIGLTNAWQLQVGLFATQKNRTLFEVNLLTWSKNLSKYGYYLFSCFINCGR